MAARAIAALLLAAGLLWVGVRGAGPAPPLGPLLDPWNGIVGTARGAELPRAATRVIPGLGDQVEVRYDDRGVPHIFAPNRLDAYRALGFVVARDRLFELELQTRATAGTLSELNPRALPLDQEARRIGLAWAAERKWAALADGDPVKQALLAYADGINAYIAQMRASERPPEYLLLNRDPMPWRPEYTFYLLSRMQWTLSWRAEDLPYLAATARFGEAAAEFLFPRHTWIQEPIQPNGRPGPRYDLAAIPGPGTPNPEAARQVALVAGAMGRRDPGTFAALGQESGIGSNNWAVAPSRTANGRALLAGDPHLDLTLPSVWYEAHLVVPDSLDVAGVTFAGTPGIIIGANRHAAWTYTNTGADVVDFYAESVDVAAAPTRYLLDGAWTPLELRIETYRGGDGAMLAVDTVRHTHRGPMTRVGDRWVSFRWTAHEPAWAAASVATFNATNTVRTVDEFWDAMLPFAVPAQNMLSADNTGQIAIRSTGRYPIRPGDGDGRRLFDGTTTKSDWIGWWSPTEYPQAKNPAQGFVVSANQEPQAPEDQPRYLGAAFAPPWRAMRINERLRADPAMTADKMRQLQTDAGSARADFFLPRLLGAADRARSAGSASASLDSATAVLGAWSRTYVPEDEAAVLFEAAMSELARRTWDEMRGDTTGVAQWLETPSNFVLAQLMEDGASRWWDDASTPAVETRDAIVAASLAAAWDTTVARHGARADGAWRWGTAAPMRIPHLLRLDAFASEPLAVRSGPHTIAPRNGASNGASWRMVAELGDTVRVLGTYPGGQSGNPFSSRYLDRTAKWVTGELDTLWMPPTLDRMDATRVRSSLTLRPLGGRP